MKDIGGIIACKGNSRRVPNKNIRKFGDSSLLEIKINQLKKFLDKVYVNSEDDKILEIAANAGAIPIKRDRHFSTDTISINKVYTAVTEDLPHDHILYAHVTSPLLKDETIKKCIDIYNNLDKNKRYNSVCTVTELKKFIWFNNKPINYDFEKMPRSQDLPNYHTIAFAINILSKNELLKNNNIVTRQYHPVILDDIESIDIDTEHEFELAEYFYNKL